MRCCAYSLVLLLGIAATLGMPAVVTADEVKIEQLLKKVPILSPDNKDLNSFQFRVEMPTELGVPFPLDVGWTRPDEFGAVFIDSKSRTPVAFIAEKKVLLYDAVTATLTLVDDVLPSVVLKADAKTIQCGFGFTTQKAKRDFTIDLPSFFRIDVRTPRLVKRDATTWQYTCLSESGMSNIIAVFEPAQPWPLRAFEIRSTTDGSLIMSVTNISINVPVEKRLRVFPSPDRFPPELKIARVAETKVTSFMDAIGLLTRLTRAIVGRLAIHNKELRQVPFLGDVDWDAAARSDAIIGPALRTLLEMPAEVPSKPGGRV